MAFSTAWYVRLVYNAVTLDFATPLTGLLVPETVVVQGQNVSLNGTVETLAIRRDQIVSLTWQFLTVADATALQTYLTGWGYLGKQGALTLDRLGTTSAQWESAFNTTFTKFQLVNTPKIQRSVRSRPLYMCQLVGMQGQ